MNPKIQPCLWFDGDAEEAMNYYVNHLPDSHIVSIAKSPADNPSTAEGEVLTVEAVIAGQPFLALNGGPAFKFTEAVSFQVICDDQAETDRLWAALTADGGEEVACGWLKDRWGLSWQIVPRRLQELIQHADPDVARRAMQAMMTMVKIDIATLEDAAQATPD
ncbi:putative 3-demethylubiquinone-9 3-methyltransferase (glyoxalase superfamily) [Haloferula luteola]|uniref:Putative 3-demethylubiquinone-9 3-methyltransferase (Glyoxalase superfamily) n=1 Tax=Haloferula luteola TaxID=595692 RepID=A0A840V4Z5_9BACT|nr:VOC family protein [Haloferula luteola]MBB5353042.1 putative 3-demethylubiquinone-9 3-methyltransferase (glyoxalase superfamily) [Haloferula luteola]